MYCFLHRVIRTKFTDVTRAADHVFSFGGGGGAKTKKGYCNVKKGTNGVHIGCLITNALMKHQVSFYMLSVVF